MGWQLGTSVSWNQWHGADNPADIGQSNQTFAQDGQSTYSNTVKNWRCS